MTYADIKKTAVKISKRFEVSERDALEILKHCNGNEELLTAFIKEDFTGLPPVADELGIPIKKGYTKRGRRGRAPGHEVIEELKAEKVERIPLEQTEVYKNGELPADIDDRLETLIQDFCARFKVDDLRKTTATVWRGMCMFVGRYIQQNRLLEDIEREARDGVKVYNAQSVERLVDVWVSLCSVFDKAPLASDFVAFSGISSSWFYNCNGHCDLTSKGGRVYKRLLELQESGLSSVLVDGRRNPTGTIFFLKNWHGWRDTREVIHTDGSESARAGALPVFDVEQIEEKPESP